MSEEMKFDVELGMLCHIGEQRANPANISYVAIAKKYPL